MANFWKGIVVGLGAIAPGLSGSVLLVIFGLYQKTIAAISTIFKNFKANLKYLLPLAAGIAVGIVAFSKLVDYLLHTFEMQTRFAFLGLILGAIPLFCKEVTQKGFHKKYILYVVAAFLAGSFVFTFNRAMFSPVEDPNLFQCILLGLAVSASYIVPGVDSAAILSALGLYELWVSSLARMNFDVLLPALVGAGCGVLGVSFLMSRLIAKCYTATFSVIFGLFLSIVPTVMYDDSCVVGWNQKTLISIVLLVVSFAASLLFSNLEKFRSKKTDT